MYGTSVSFGSFWVANEGAELSVLRAEGGLASGRPANGLRIRGAVSRDECEGWRAGMVGRLLVDGRGGRVLVSCFGCSSIGAVSVLRKLANLEGGGGRDPDGRLSRRCLRSRRYWAG